MVTTADAVHGSGQLDEHPESVKQAAVAELHNEAATLAATLLEVVLESGRKHQIRVHLAETGHPLLGDRTYAPPKIAARAPRHLLHAAELRFEEIAASAAMPADWPH